MTKHKDCIFVAEEDCPKEKIDVNCKACEEHKYYETIDLAVHDFVSLGDAFTDLFKMSKQLIDHDGKTIDVVIPILAINIINRAMTALLTTRELETNNEIVYRRLIFYFFKIIVDEFEEEEYAEPDSVH